MRIQLAQSVEKILRSRIFLFLCIRLYVIEKEDRAEETHQGVRFYSGQLAEKQIFSASRAKQPSLSGGLFCFSSKPPLQGAHIIYSSKKASRRRLFS